MPGDRTPGRVMLLDAASLYFRAFFGVPDRRVSPTAAPVNAVRGFADMIATLVAAHRPDRLVACWDDDWRPQFRVAAIPSYKAHRLAPGSADREEVPEALAVQIPLIVELLASVGLDRVGCPGYEADDVIGTLTTRLSGRSLVDIVTGDRDLFQLVNDQAGVRVLYTARGGVRAVDVVDQGYLLDRYGIRDGAGYADVAVLRGDPSDGLPGVRGIGEKTATQLVARFGDLQGVFRAAVEDHPELTAGQRRRLIDGAEYLAVAPSVVRVARDCPVPPVAGELPRRVADPQRLAGLLTEHDLAGPVTRLLEALGTSP